MITIKGEGSAGQTFEEVIDNAVEVAKRLNCAIEVKMNEVTVLFFPNTDKKQVLKNFKRAQSLGIKFAS